MINAHWTLKFLPCKVLSFPVITCWNKSHNHPLQSCVRYLSAEIRNIGIMAHIDAGKTTTTERMLYYSGFIKQMGDIDSGDTVMDYLSTERERGITVQSATISFHWLDALINLIDTPGHVDFTIEVERSLRVLDGAIAIFDASKGVEAQSRTVWRQADHYKVPRIAFINKMDKSKADLSASINSIKNQLKANTILLQLPVIKNSTFIGIIDLVNMKKIEWDSYELMSNRSARQFSTKELSSTDQDWDTLIEARTSVIEQLCELYDDVANVWLEGENAGDARVLSPETLRSWLRRATIERTAVPILCGSSLKNIAVQPLLDAVVYYLPKPSDIQHDFTNYYKNTLTAMAFKVLHDKKMGPLVFVRLYSGNMTNSMDVYNANKSCSEKIGRLMNVYANEYRNVSRLSAGEIGLVAGLNKTMTGDTLVKSKETFDCATIEAENSLTGDFTTEHSKSAAVLSSVAVHEPVFFCTVEVQSITQEKALNQALIIITREDPSVHVQYADEGSVILSGMGELHMDIILERLHKEFKVDAYIGPLQVAYREVPTESSRHTEKYERTILGKSHLITVDISVSPSPSTRAVTDVSHINRHSASGLNEAAAQGIVQACHKGLILGYPVMWAKFKLRSVEANSDCPSTLVTAAAFKCTQKVLELAECQLVEPMMRVEVNTPLRSYEDTMNQLHKCHAVIDDVTSSDDNELVSARAPVSEMKGFSSSLRSATSGLADFTLEMAGYQPVDEKRLERVKDELSGLKS